MSKKRFRSDRGFVFDDRKLAKGPNGRNLCRWCQIEVPPRRQTFCSAKCVYEWKLRTNAGFVRMQVHARDKGVCALCGLDTDQLSRFLLSIYLVDPEQAHANAWIFGFGNAFKNLKFRWNRYPRPRSLWQADHILPVVEGGGECGLEGYRTLCLPCHKRVTAQLRDRLKQRKCETRGNNAETVDRSTTTCATRQRGGDTGSLG